MSRRGLRRGHLLSNLQQLSGRELSFNNLNDLAAARLLLEEFELPACVIVKHANPCGFAVAATIEEAYERALAPDPVSAFGGVVVLNRPVETGLGPPPREQFVEVLLAPGFADDALAALREKPAVRIIRNDERGLAASGWRDYRRVPGGFLVQDADSDVDERDEMTVVSARSRTSALGRPAPRLAGRQARDLERDRAGEGARDDRCRLGQMSRVDAVRIALEKAREHGHDLDGRRARIRRLLPVRGRTAARARGGGGGDRPARRVEARRGRDRGRRRRRSNHGLHPQAPLPALGTVP